jgi:hypothetical protein
LAAPAEDAIGSRFCSAIEIGIWKDNVRRLASKFQDDGL